MIVTGVIAEYNPFHNGHKYQLEQARRLTGADYIIVVMNGNFMQRGTPAMWNKYVRAEAAVANGADLVLELPVLYGTASAEFFALGGVRLLDQLRIVSHLCYGCETTDHDLLSFIARLLTDEPPVYRQTLNQALSHGMSFPKARASAILHTLEASPVPIPDGLEAFLSMPNTILALEYEKALLRCNSPILSVPCQRISSTYHDTALRDTLSSASAIRREYVQTGCSEHLRTAVPSDVYQALAAERNHRAPMDMDSFYPFLQYLFWNPPHPLTDYQDISEDLANRMHTVYQPEYTYSEFTEALIHKQYTYTRIYRCLLHMLLDIRKEDFSYQIASSDMHYARILAFRKESAPLLRELHRSSQIPLITKLTDGLQALNRQADFLGETLLQKDIAASHLYEQAVANRYLVPAINEYTHPLIIL